MTDLQALVAGYLTAALKLAPERGGLLVDVEILRDETGGYVPELLVTGRESRERVIIRIEVAR